MSAPPPGEPPPIEPAVLRARQSPGCGSMPQRERNTVRRAVSPQAQETQHSVTAALRLP